MWDEDDVEGVDDDVMGGGKSEAGEMEPACGRMNCRLRVTPA